MSNDLAVPGQTAPAELIAMAIEKNAGVETLEKLMILQERYEANEARKAYHKAMASFKLNPPTIKKTKDVDFKNKAGVRTQYKYADLAEAANLIGMALSKEDLSASWRTEQADDKITVTCVITHILGHSESTPMTAPPDTSGNKDSIKAIASTVTYLQRYTLMAITGLAAGGIDDDGQGANEMTFIDEEQTQILAELIKDTDTDAAKFCEYFKVDTLDTLFAVDYKRAVSWLEEKKKRMAK